MNRSDVDWKGYWAAAPTPFSADGAFDAPVMKTVLNALVHAKVQGLVVNGTTGEWMSQSIDERRTVAEHAVKVVRKAVPVLVGVHTLQMTDGVILARHAESVGADGLLACPPLGLRLTVPELVGYFERLSSVTQLPFMVYNAPKAVPVDLGGEAINALADLPNIVALKDSTTSQMRFLDNLQIAVGRLRVFGDLVNPLGLAVMRGGLGGDGYIGAGALMGSRHGAYFERAWHDDDARVALGIAQQFERLEARLFGPSSRLAGASLPAVLKAAMAITGVDAGYPRLPLKPVNDEQRAEIQAALVAADSIAVAP